MISKHRQLFPKLRHSRGTYEIALSCEMREGEVGSRKRRGKEKKRKLTIIVIYLYQI